MVYWLGRQYGIYYRQVSRLVAGGTKVLPPVGLSILAKVASIVLVFEMLGFKLSFLSYEIWF